MTRHAKTTVLKLVLGIATATALSSVAAQDSARQSIHWLSEPSANGIRLGVEYLTCDESKCIRPIVSFRAADPIVGPSRPQRFTSKHSLPEPRPVDGAVLTDRARAYIAVREFAGDRFNVTVYPCDLIARRFLQPIMFDQGIDCIYELREIPGSDCLLEQSLCVYWRSNMPTMECPGAPLQLRVLDENYAEIWKQRFAVPAINPPASCLNRPFDCIVEKRVELVRLSPQKFVIGDEGSFRVELRDHLWGVVPD